jgi:DNA-directed RNA polymerase subunit beta
MVGDKIVLRAGNKGIVSKIIPDDEMPRTEDGQPVDVLLNQLGIPSRVNDSMVYELLLGKIAKASGQPIKVPAFTAPGESWREVIRGALNEAGIPDKERLYDPKLGRYLRKPVLVGDGYILKLHHIAESKLSARGQAAYDANEQPLKGGSEAAQAKRDSGLEVAAALSSGAYATLRESSTLRGQANDEFWRTLREGNNPNPPGVPFVWHKFRALLSGAGVNTRDFPDGRIRLGPMTDRALAEYKPITLKNGEIVNPVSLDPEPGGLFDEALVGGNKWGQIELPRALPNPAYEDAIRAILGLTKKQFADVLAGKASLDDFKD